MALQFGDSRTHANVVQVSLKDGLRLDIDYETIRRGQIKKSWEYKQGLLHRDLGIGRSCLSDVLMIHYSGVHPAQPVQATKT